MPRGIALANACLLAVLGGLLALSAASLAAYASQPEAYRFGTEVGGVLYRSRAHYLGALLLEALVLMGSLVLSLRPSPATRVLGLRLGAVLMDVLFLLATRPLN